MGGGREGEGEGGRGRGREEGEKEGEKGREGGGGGGGGEIGSYTGTSLHSKQTFFLFFLSFLLSLVEDFSLTELDTEEVRCFPCSLDRLFVTSTPGATGLTMSSLREMGLTVSTSGGMGLTLSTPAGL